MLMILPSFFKIRDPSDYLQALDLVLGTIVHSSHHLKHDEVSPGTSGDRHPWPHTKSPFQGLCFLVDTGAEVTTHAERKHPSKGSGC